MKKIQLEFVVGLFMIAGFLSLVYISLQFGEFSIFSLQKTYTVVGLFDNVSGLKKGAVVEMAGVKIGTVSSITLNANDRARVAMQIDKEVKISEDSMASIKTQGIIGDKYVKIEPGASDTMLADNGVLTETESAVDLEGLVSKYIFGQVK